jgi:hypothetical protein
MVGNDGPEEEGTRGDLTRLERFRAWLRPKGFAFPDLIEALSALLVPSLVGSLFMDWTVIRFTLWAGIACFVLGSIHGLRMAKNHYERMIGLDVVVLTENFERTVNETIGELIRAGVLQYGPNRGRVTITRH